MTNSDEPMGPATQERAQDSPLLKLAEAYYEVARDLEYRAQEYARCAAMLNAHADALCEVNMREAQP